MVLDGAEPEADHVDGGGLRPKLAFAGDFGLLQVDARVGRRAVHGRDVVERGEVGDGGADIAAVEEVRAAGRLALGMERRVRLFPVERWRGVGRKQIGIARDEIVVAVAPVEIGMEGEVAGAGVEHGAAFEAAVDRGGRALQLGLPAARRGGKRNAVVGCFHDAADRLRAVAQCFRAAVDFDLLGRQRIDRHPVVLAVVGDVHGADAVLLHADAEIVEPMQYRALRAGRQTGGGRAGRGEEEPAEALALTGLDLRAVDAGERWRGLER